MDCKREYNQIPYNCDNCGTPIIIPRWKAEKLKTGERKHVYCSHDCHNQAQITSVEKVCEYCGKTYFIFKCYENTQKYCSRECFEKYRDENARKNQPRICEYCGKTFYTDSKIHKYCSYECSAKAQQKRITCTCEYCGKEFDRIVSEVEKNNKHYCSNACRIFDKQWSEHDRNILREYYRKIPNKDILPLLSKKYNEKALRSEAGRLGLYQSRLWTDEEIDLFKSLYPTVPMKDVLKAFPERTETSLLGMARKLNIKSYFYNKQIYTNEEIQYLKDNYLSKTNKELAEELLRTSSSISQRLRILGLQRPFDPKTVCYKEINDYVRTCIQPWRNHYKQECNYTCCITGKRSNIVVHHCRGFNLLIEETIDILDFQLLDNFGDYSTKDLERFVEKFIELQEYYGEYVCITEEVHKLFHKNYGYGNNTIEQWNEFVMNYHNGLYNKVA